MSNIGKYGFAALVVAVITHFALIHATPRMLMNVAFERLSAGGVNSWRVADRVTPLSRTIVRPSPDFAYSSCAYDLSRGPLSLGIAPWHAYWSISLYAGNSDNYFVLDDREARNGADLVLVRAGRSPPDTAARIVQSPSTRGIALIRRLAPTTDEYNRAREVARSDLCTALTPQSQ